MSMVEDFALQFRALLARGMSTSLVRGRVGLLAASEAWGGAEPRDRPGWYLWSTARPGVYQLDVHDAERLDDGACGALLGRMSVRYYPSPFDPDLAKFSPEERTVAADGWLDATGAPRIEVAHAIPPTLFVVGTLDCAFDCDGGLLAVAVGALDRIRTTSVEAMGRASRPSGVVAHEPGGLIRDVPGWRVTTPTLAMVAGLGALLGGRRAARVVVSRQRGFETVRVGAATEQRDSDEVIHGETVVALRGNEDGGRAERIAALLADPEAETLVDLAPAGPVPASVSPDPRLELAIDSTWFGEDTPPQDAVGCTC